MNKRDVINICLCIFLRHMAIVNPVLANDSTELCKRLNYINGFYAKFTQQITDSTGKVLQENNGELWIRHPCCFNYHILFPKEEELFVISNGKILWFYDPGVNQVIVSWLKDVCDNTFLMLLIGDLKLTWSNQYSIIRKSDNFFLTPKKNEDFLFKKIKIQITDQGIINNIDVFNEDNYCIRYQLTKHDVCFFDFNKFNFLPPDGVKIDSQL